MLRNASNAVSTTATISPADRRQILLRTAEELFASRGIDAVSLNEINKTAGQRNTSALHYHFGSKEKLIDAIIYQEFDSIVARMNEEFDKLEAVEDFDSLVLDRNANMPFFSQPQSAEAVSNRAFAMASPFFGAMPEPVKMVRLILFSSLIFRSLVTYAQFQLGSGNNIMGSRELFFAVLCESLERVIFGPLSDEVLQCATQQP